MRPRLVERERIKLLSASGTVSDPDRLGPDSGYVRGVILAKLGHEIAQKLLEFNKVLITLEGDKVSWSANVEVIVPRQAPGP